MKKLIAGAGALFLSSSAFAAALYAAPTSHSPILSPTAYNLSLATFPVYYGLSDGMYEWEEFGVDAKSLDTETDAKSEKMADGMDDTMSKAGAEDLAMGWPACRPGPGDDRCIQLYEAGVRPAFAEWKAGGSEYGMGGPEEPMMDENKSTAMSNEIASGSAMVAKDASLAPMETTAMHGSDSGDKDAMAAVHHPQMSDTDMMASHMSGSNGMTAEQMQSNSAYASLDGAKTEYTGVGGPDEDEATRVYPRCTSRSDDRCQQGS
jgi:hypothetical protein